MKQNTDLGNEKAVIAKDFINDFDTALSNDAYAAVCQLLKDETCDPDEDAELADEGDRECYDNLNSIRRREKEYCCLHSKKKIGDEEFLEFLYEMKDELDSLDVDLEETRAVFEDFDMEW